MKAAALKYIKEVLGVSEVLIPEDLKVEPIERAEELAFDVSGSLDSSLLIVIPEPVSEANQALLQKMIQAMKVSEYCLASSVNPASFPQLEAQFRGQVVLSFGLNVTSKSKTLFQTHSLTKLLKKSAQQTQMKKATWSVLKQVMEALGLVH